MVEIAMVSGCDNCGSDCYFLLCYMSGVANLSEV